MLIVLIVTGTIYAESQQPPQSPKAIQQEAHSTNTNQKTASDQRGNEKSPLVVKVLPTKEIEEEAAQAQKERKEKTELDRKLTEYTKDLSIYTKDLSAFTAVLAVAAILQLIVFGLQAWKLHQTVKATKESANAALKSTDAFKASERAYVKMSHCPPGLYPAPAPHSIYVVKMRVKNFGQTPATVTDLLLTKKVLPRNERLPMVPDYSVRAAGESPNIFLVREDESFTSYNFPISNEERSSIEDGTQILYVYGYIDYIDRFGCRHRAGYARRFNGEIGGEDNLKFVIQEGYNYDRPRNKGEGNDWNEPSA